MSKKSWWNSFTSRVESSLGGSNSFRSRHSTDGESVQQDRITQTGSGKHTHDSVTVDKNTGKVREYSGGENSKDRGYNKEPHKENTTRSWD